MKDDFSHIQDQILVMDAQDRDAAALDKLIDRWQKPFWSHALRLVNNSDAAWDITQQSWMAIIRGLRKLQDPAAFKPWAYRIVTNKSFDWIRKKEKHKHKNLDEVDQNAQSSNADTGIKELLNKLGTAKKLVVNLHYFDQLSVAEISVVLNIPKGTVKSRLHNARNELKELWLQQSQ